jgi:hypothetical protein
MTFETEIINNPNYLKFKNVRRIMFVILLIYGTPAYFLGAGSPSKKNDFSNELSSSPELMIYYMSLLVLLIIYGIIHYSTWRMRNLGRLTIMPDRIKVEDKGNLTQIELTKIQRLSITRNSTYHKIDYVGKPYPGNNWLEITGNKGEKQSYEFTINNEDHNEKFEQIIQNLLKKMGSKVKYKSI